MTSGAGGTRRPGARAARPRRKTAAKPQTPVPEAPAPAQRFARASSSPSSAPELEPGLARLLRDVDAAHDAETRRRAAAALGQIAARLAPPAQAPGTPSAEDLLAVARRLVSRTWGSAGALRVVEDVDAFGMDPSFAARAQPVLDWLFEKYFRVAVEGIEHVPDEGAALLVCNRGGVLPWDGLMLKTALRTLHPARRGLRWLTEDFVYHAPFLGVALNRMGAARACQENAERLLRDGHLLAVFPEGEKGVGKAFGDRYRLQRFGRGGYLKLALRTGVPLIPVAIVGAEDSYPLLHRVTAFSRLLGLPFIPVTPLFPWLGALGLVPLPSRWRIAIGPAVAEVREQPAAVADDAARVSALSERVRATLQRMIDEALIRRGSRTYAWPKLGLA